MTRTTTRTQSFLQRLLTALTVALFASCASSGSDSAVKDSGWIQPSPILAQQIQDEAARLPWTHGFERFEQIRWFASVGEPAYPTLLELANDPRDGVSAAALAALGATMDRRLVPSIQSLDWSPSRANSDLRFERARALLRLGDWSDIPVLSDGLRDERTYTRALSLEALKESTRQTMGYDPHADEELRAEGIERWERWWMERAGDAMLPTTNG